MNKSVLDWLKVNRTIAVECIAAFILSVVVTGALARWKYKVALATEGFDFSARKTGPSAAPIIGDAIDINALRGRMAKPWLR